MLSRDDLLAALAAIPVDAPVRAEEVTGSTNATAIELAEAGSAEWTLVSAAHQTDGRGRLGRTWSDVPDGSLLCSIVLRPALPPSRAGLLSLLAGACMAEAIRDTSGRRVTCKWPNDLMHREDKVGGILLESAVDDDVLCATSWSGSGVNLQSPADVEGAGGIGERVGMRELLTAFLVRFANTYTTDDASLPERVAARVAPGVGHDRPGRAARPRATVAPSRAGPWASTVSARSSCPPTTASCASASARSSTSGPARRFALPRGAR